MAMTGRLQHITMVSFEICNVKGLYWSSGCGHAAAKVFADGETFPACSTCGKPIRWIQMNAGADLK
jgi:hypothetical protein